MAQPWSEGGLLVPRIADPVHDIAVDAADLLARDEGFGGLRPIALGLGAVDAGTSRAKPMAVAVTLADPPQPTRDMIASSLASSTSWGGLRDRGEHSLFESDLRDQPGRTCWRLLVLLDDGSELTPGPFRIAGRATDWPATPVRGRDLATDGGRPDRPPQADRPARGTHGSTDRGTKGGRSER